MESEVNTITHVIYYRVILGDTDAGGIVYHPRYLEMAERGRNEVMLTLGLDIHKLNVEDGYIMMIRSCNMKFRNAALLADRLSIQTHIKKLSMASSTWISVIRRGATEICTAHVEIICVDRGLQRPVLFPEHVLNAFRSA